MLFIVAFACAAPTVAITGPEQLRAVAQQPGHLVPGGVLVAFYVLTITYVAPTSGGGNAVFFVLPGQLARTAAIDRFGLFGARVTPVSGLRLMGIAVRSAGVAITPLAGR